MIASGKALQPKLRPEAGTPPNGPAHLALYRQILVGDDARQRRRDRLLRRLPDGHVRGGRSGGTRSPCLARAGRRGGAERSAYLRLLWKNRRYRSLATCSAIPSCEASARHSKCVSDSTSGAGKQECEPQVAPLVLPASNFQRKLSELRYTSRGSQIQCAPFVIILNMPNQPALSSGTQPAQNAI